MIRKHGFTLTELLTIVILIATVAVVVLPKFTKVFETQKTAEAEKIMSAVRTEQEARCMLNKNYTTKASNLAMLPQNTGDNYTFSLKSTGIEAASVKGSYTLKMPSYADGRICCSGTDCASLNKSYPTCSELESMDDYEAPVACQSVVVTTKEVVAGSEPPRDPIAYVNNTEGAELLAGDSCTTNSNYGCKTVTSVGATCTAANRSGCQYSTFTEQSTCNGSQLYGCLGSTFTDSTCIGDGQASCSKNTFTNSTCEGNGNGKDKDNVTCGQSEYINSTCRNNAKNGYVCGTGSFSSSTCYGNTYGGCGRSTFDNGSKCYGDGATACTRNTFKGGSVCYANVKGACGTDTTFEDTSYCEGAYCPKGTPRKDGTIRTAMGE